MERACTPSTRKPVAAAKAALPSIPEELIDPFVAGLMSAEAVNAASMVFKKALIERALGAELSHQLGYSMGGTKPEEALTDAIMLEVTAWQTRPIESDVPGGLLRRAAREDQGRCGGS